MLHSNILGCAVDGKMFVRLHISELRTGWLQEIEMVIVKRHESTSGRKRLLS